MDPTDNKLDKESEERSTNSCTSEYMLSDDEIRGLEILDEKLEDSLFRQIPEAITIMGDRIIGIVMINSTKCRLVLTDEEFLFAIPQCVWGEYNMDMAIWLEDVPSKFWLADTTYKLLRISFAFFDPFDKYDYDQSSTISKKRAAVYFFMKNFYSNHECYTQIDYYKLKNGARRTFKWALYDLFYTDWYGSVKITFDGMVNALREPPEYGKDQ